MTDQPIKPFREWFADKYGVENMDEDGVVTTEGERT